MRRRKGWRQTDVCRPTNTKQDGLRANTLLLLTLLWVLVKRWILIPSLKIGQAYISQLNHTTTMHNFPRAALLASVLVSSLGLTATAAGASTGSSWGIASSKGLIAKYQSYSTDTTTLSPSSAFISTARLQQRHRLTRQYNTSTHRPSARVPSIPLFATSLDEDEDDKECDLQQLYQQVQKEDSDWYFQTLSKLLGEEVGDPIELVDCAKEAKEANNSVAKDEELRKVAQGDAASKESGDSITERDSGDAATQQQDGEIDDSTEESMPNETVTITEYDIESIEDEREQSKQRRPAKRIEYIAEDTYSEDKTILTKDDTRIEQQTSLDAYTELASQSSPPSQVVRLVNTFTKEFEDMSPLSKLLELGYNEKQVSKLRPQVLELIVEDNIPRPRRGIPMRWVRLEDEEEDDEDYEWAVEIVDAPLQKQETVDKADGERSGKSNINVDASTEREAANPDIKSPPVKSDTSSKVSGEKGDSVPTTNRLGQDRKERIEEEMADEYTDQSESGRRRRRPLDETSDMPRKRNSRSAPSSRRSSYDNEEEEFERRREHTRRSPSRNREQQRRASPPSRRRELFIDRGEDDDDDPPPNKFWMDIGTFRDFLRAEARLRLKVLGPDWKESVLDESRWRFDLYKRWLYLLDDGVGENPLYTYGDRPRQPRAQRQRREEVQPQRQPSRRERGYDDDLEQPRRRRQSESSQEERTRDVDTNDDNREPERRQRPRAELRGDDERDYEPPRRRKRSDIEEDEADDGISSDESNSLSRNSDVREDDERKPIRNKRSAPPPPRRTRDTQWKNFNDLEESLQRSSARSSGRQSREEYDDNDKIPQDDAPKRRKRSSDDVWREGY